MAVSWSTLESELLIRTENGNIIGLRPLHDVLPVVARFKEAADPSDPERQIAVRFEVEESQDIPKAVADAFAEQWNQRRWIMDRSWLEGLGPLKCLEVDSKSSEEQKLGAWLSLIWDVYDVVRKKPNQKLKQVENQLNQMAKHKHYQDFDHMVDANRNTFRNRVISHLPRPDYYIPDEVYGAELVDLRGREGIEKRLEMIPDAHCLTVRQSS